MMMVIAVVAMRVHFCIFMIVALLLVNRRTILYKCMCIFFELNECIYISRVHKRTINFQTQYQYLRSMCLTALGGNTLRYYCKNC